MQKYPTLNIHFKQNTFTHNTNKLTTSVTTAIT